jgi:hypothetical protein
MAFPMTHPADREPNARYTRLLAQYHYGSYTRRASELAWTLVDTLTRAGR